MTASDSSPRGRSPWLAEDTGRVAVAVAVAIGTIFTSRYQIDRSTQAQDQIHWFLLGFGGLVFASVSLGLWLVRLQRIVFTRRGETADRIRKVLHVASTRASAPTRSVLVAVPGMSRFHTPDCPFAARSTTHDLHEIEDRSGLKPCPVCMP